MAGKFETYASLSAPADADLLAGVDVSDTSMSALGTTKRLTLADLRTYMKAGPASAGATPGNPAATTSATLVMMGLGSSCAITPGSSGKILVTVTGEISEATGAVTTTWGGRYGTGTAPVNGAAVSGTRFGAAADFTTQTPAGIKEAFAFTALLALTPGTAYWFDIGLGSNGVASASVSNIGFTALEVS